MSNALTSRSGMIWIQPGGPGPFNPVYALACHDGGDLSKPVKDKAPIRCFNDAGDGWEVVGETISPPDFPTTSIDTLMFSQRDYLEKQDCSYSLYFLMRECGDASVFTNYIRGEVLTNAESTQITYSNMRKREEDSNAAISAAIKGWDLIPVDEVTAARIDATGFALALNDVIGNTEKRCIGDGCGDALSVGELLVAPADSAVGPATGDVLFSTDFAESWAAGAADPFGAGFNTVAVTRCYVNKTTSRWIVSREGLGAAVQGQVAYTDNAGANWTVVSVGGAAAGHGAVRGGGLFCLRQNPQYLWLASVSGYIYKSTNAGVTWTAVEEGTIAATSYSQVHFADAYHGMAVTDAGIVARSVDGGNSWTAATPIAGGAFNLCVQVIDERRAWVGDDDGKLWYTDDFGTTWTQVTQYPANGVGDVQDLHAVNDHVIYAVSNSAAPVGTIYRTINGGANWETITTPDNDGLNAIYMFNEHYGVVVGEVEGAAEPVIIKIDRA